MADRTFETQEVDGPLELVAAQGVVITSQKSVPWTLIEVEARDHETSDRSRGVRKIELVEQLAGIRFPLHFTVATNLPQAVHERLPDRAVIAVG